MKKLINIALASLVALSAVGCYSDFDNPAPAPIFSDADFVDDCEIITIKDLKERYKSFVGASKSEEITDNLVIRGKVISSDKDGNVYKSLYILDHDMNGSAAIELRLFASNYVKYPVGTMIYVKLKGLSIGDYSGMLSIGSRSVDPDYAHSTIEGSIMLKEHIFVGERLEMTPSDTLVVNKDNYMNLTNDALARLVRFEGVESVFGKAAWGYKNSYPNYFAGSDDNFEWSADQADLAEPTVAFYGQNPNLEYINASMTRYYGSSWYSYNPEGTDNLSGQYVVRTSGYARFRDQKIPANGSKVNLTAIYTQFGSGATKAYQLTINKGADIVEVK